MNYGLIALNCAAFLYQLGLGDRLEGLLIAPGAGPGTGCGAKTR